MITRKGNKMIALLRKKWVGIHITGVLFMVLSSSLAVGAVAGAGNETTNSGGLISAGVNAACMDFKAVGGCLWVTCIGPVCKYDYSIKYAHNIPELVVSSYKNTGENPWQDVSSFSLPTSMAEDGGSNTEGATTNNEQAIRFKNVDIIGSPANLTYDSMASNGTFCEPAARAYMPYYLSTLDFTWRNELIEGLLAFPNILKTIRKGMSEFAPLYPRIGFSHQGHDYKSGFIHAKRAAHFVTRNWQPHVYYPAVWGSSKEGQWPPEDPVDDDTLWQQVIPSGNTDCTTLPDIDDSTGISDPYSDRLNEAAGYIWHIWRRYRCCDKEGAVLVFHTGS